MFASAQQVCHGGLQYFQRRGFFQGGDVVLCDEAQMVLMVGGGEEKKMFADIRVKLDRLSIKFDAVHLRHADIGNHHVKAALTQALQCFGGVGCDFQLAKGCHDDFMEAGNDRIVVDNQNTFFPEGRQIVNRLVEFGLLGLLALTNVFPEKIADHGVFVTGLLSSWQVGGFVRVKAPHTF